MSTFILDTLSTSCWSYLMQDYLFVQCIGIFTGMFIETGESFSLSRVRSAPPRSHPSLCARISLEIHWILSEGLAGSHCDWDSSLTVIGNTSWDKTRAHCDHRYWRGVRKRKGWNRGETPPEITQTWLFKRMRAHQLMQCAHTTWQ